MAGWLPPVTYWGTEWGDEWDNADPASWAGWSGWAPDPAPARPLAPRCGRGLAVDGRYERAGMPGDPGKPPVCGRREGHNPPCRSEAAVARYLRADLDRQARSRGRSRAA